MKSKTNYLINDIHNIIFEIESAIIKLTSKEKLQSALNLIESRMDFNLQLLNFNKKDTKSIISCVLMRIQTY